jgi:hypothetical protein
MIQVIECLLSNHEVLGSIPIRAKKKTTLPCDHPQEGFLTFQVMNHHLTVRHQTPGGKPLQILNTRTSLFGSDNLRESVFSLFALTIRKLRNKPAFQSQQWSRTSQYFHHFCLLSTTVFPCLSFCGGTESWISGPCTG